MVFWRIPLKFNTMSDKPKLLRKVLHKDRLAPQKPRPGLTTGEWLARLSSRTWRQFSAFWVNLMVSLGAAGRLSGLLNLPY